MELSLPLKRSLFILLVLLVGGFQNTITAQTNYVQSADTLGLVVITAEDFSAYRPGSGIKEGDEWTTDNAIDGYIGTGYMQSEMASGDGDVGNAETVNARLTYNVEFVKSGTHYLWAHVYFGDGSSDSFFYGLDSSVIARVQGEPYGSFRWDEGDNSFEVTAGVHTIDIMQREPNAIVDHIIITSNADFDPTTDDSWIPSAYLQRDDSLGLVIIPAEDFSAYRPGNGIKEGDEWLSLSDTAGFFGEGYMQSLMLGGGDGSTSNAENFNAMLTYNVEFVKEGAHYLWAHVHFDNGDSDSFFYGIDGSSIARVQGSPYGSFRWDEGDASFEVVPGMHTIDIMQREPNAKLDHIIISSDPDFDPRTNTSWLPTSADATLSALSVEGTDLMPTFSPGNTSYSIFVLEGTPTVTVSATAAQAGATIVGDGVFDIATGGNTISVVVTAEDGTTTLTYTIDIIIRPLEPDFEVIQAEDYVSKREGLNFEEWVEADTVPGFFGESFMLAPDFSSYAPYEVALEQAPTMSYDVLVPEGEAGTYYLWSYVNFPNGSGDSFYYGVADTINSENSRLSYFTEYNVWRWAEGPETIQLEEGQNTLTIYAREKGMKVDMLLLTPDEFYDPSVDSSWMDVPTPVSSIEAFDLVKVFPNPTRNTLFVTGIEAGAVLSFYDMTGRLLQSEYANGSDVSIDISSFRSGVYMLQVISENRRKVTLVMKNE